MNSGSPPPWLTVHRGHSPLLVSIPHAGTAIPPAIAARLADPWRGLKDVDWWVDRLYAFAPDLGATVVRTETARTVIDVNRDPSGASLYPGAATTGLCPETTFDGEALWREGEAPGPDEVAMRRETWLQPYHATLAAEIARLRGRWDQIVLFDAHSIRSKVPRLFDGELPHLNFGTNSGISCAPELTTKIEEIAEASTFSHITDGRFRGGWITRAYGRPARGVYAVQLELACRSYMDEPEAPPAPVNWPPAFDAARAAPLVTVLRELLGACIAFAEQKSREDRT